VVWFCYIVCTLVVGFGFGYYSGLLCMVFVADFVARMFCGCTLFACLCCSVCERLLLCGVCLHVSDAVVWRCVL